MVSHYIQWLDGAYLELASGKPFIVKPSLLRTTVSLLKLHALFGANIYLSDAQVNDSHVVLHLFSSPSFRNFLKSQESFLHQSVPPYRVGKETDPFSLATVSLRRSLENDWISSTFDDPEISKTMARVILEDGTKNSGVIDLERQINDKDSGYRKAVRQWPEHERLLEGMLHGVAYFATPGKTSVSKYNGEPQNQWNMLHEAIDALNKREVLKEGEVVNEKEERVERTIEFIIKSIKDERKRQYQSDVFAALRKEFDPRSFDYRIIGETVHHAWNAAVQRSIGTDCGSLGHLSNQGVQVGLYLGKPTDSLVPRITKKKEYSANEFSKKIRGIINWDPARLSWVEISRLLDTEIKKTAIEFQESLISDSEAKIIEATTQHVENLNHYFSELASPRELATYPLVFNGWIWIFSGLVAIGMGFTFELGTNIPSSSSLVKEVADMALAKALYHGEGSIMTNTLNKVANRMRLHYPT